MITGREALGAIDLTLLTTLVVLVEERSTVRAAERLHLAQSTVSGSLARLREVFGDPLLVRHHNTLEPTPRALEIADAARPHLLGLAAAVGAARPFDPLSDTRIFRLGCTDAAALAILPALTARLRADAPNCDLLIRVGDFRVLPGMLDSDEVTTALAYFRDSPPAAFKVRTLRHSPWVVLRNRSEPTIVGVEDFAARTHALVTPSGDLTGFVDVGLAKLGRTRRVVVGVTSFVLLLAVLPGSRLVATVPDFVARRFLELGDFAADPCPVEIPPVTNTLAWRLTADRDPAERWFRAQLIEAFSAA